jgi:putative FmdB family regulatory protein
MPIYEYQCQKCGTFEVTQRITENPLSKCPTCRGRVKKLISNTSFQLKGTGWYITDYARKGQDSSKTENGSKPSSDGKAESKGESKAESKSESKKDSTSKSSDKPSSPTSSSTSA